MRPIDADALVAEFHRLTLGENSLIERFFADGVYAVIDTFPTADVEPVRHAYWKQVSNKSPKYACSDCNHLFNNKEYKGCPFCRAKMDGKVKKKK